MTIAKLTIAEAVRILSGITTHDEAGTHYTARYSSDDLDELEARGLLVQHKPVHDATGIRYSQEHWSVEVTEDGGDLVDANPEYHDAAGWPECWIATDREGLAVYGVAESAFDAIAAAMSEGCDPATLLVVRASVDLANRVNIYGGSREQTGDWHIIGRHGRRVSSTTYAYDHCRDERGIASDLMADVS